jgi:deoxycytidine triphosphate deaminase
MRCCQLALIGMSGPAILPYGHDKLGSKYQGQSEATPSRYSTNRVPSAPTTNVITTL